MSQLPVTQTACRVLVAASSKDRLKFYVENIEKLLSRAIESEGGVPPVIAKMARSQEVGDMLGSFIFIGLGAVLETLNDDDSVSMQILNELKDELRPDWPPRPEDN